MLLAGLFSVLVIAILAFVALDVKVCKEGNHGHHVGDVGPAHPLKELALAIAHEVGGGACGDEHKEELQQLQLSQVALPPEVRLDRVTAGSEHVVPIPEQRDGDMGVRVCVCACVCVCVCVCV